MNYKTLTAYELIKEETLTGIKSHGTLLRHKKSGARILAIENSDENKVFSIAFRTPVKNSTGVPHIMEHSVLCGSKNFPAKDPFVELVKGSLNTFLNAMTYPDKTVYPVASCNDTDFQNLMHIYLDAVLYPNIYEREEIFRQEGWSYELESADSELVYNGVVYNEMKGAFSSPEGVLDRAVLNTLFPDTNYAHESGGDPECIPDLTYEEFLDFHRTYYHPSNSYIYLYGDMDMAEKLTWLDETYLSDFTAITIDSEIPKQEPFPEMIERVIPYSISSDESEEDNTYLSYNKVIGTSLDRELYVAFEILDYALLSAPGAPLKKALTDAGIGQDVLGSYDNGIYQPIFSVIAKNANMEQKEAFVELIENVLREQVEHGIDQDALAAGINYQEFRYREADFGNYPKGLMYGLQLMDSWLYDEEQPFIHIEMLGTYAFLKEKIGTGYYEELIQNYLLENAHGAIVIVSPEKGRTAKMEEALAAKLASYKASLSAEEVQKLVEATAHLKEYQSEEDSDEILEKIPLLSRADLRREATKPINEELHVDDTFLLYHDVDTNGIAYVDYVFDLGFVKEEDLTYLSILQSVLGIIDTENYAYGDLFNRINLYTGGISSSLETYVDVSAAPEEQKKYRPTFEIKGKALYEHVPTLTDMMIEILTRSNLSDAKRIKEILLMQKSRMLMRFQSAGHTTAVGRAQSYHAPVAMWKDLTSGIGYYRAICKLLEDFENVKEDISKNLYRLARQIFRKDNVFANITAYKSEGGIFEEEIRKLRDAMSDEQVDATPRYVSCERKNEGFKTASKVQYVAQTGNFLDAGVPYSGALQILKTILSYEYLWQNIRVQGGAYGCMTAFNRLGEGFFVSYRDPHLKETFDVYAKLTEYVKNFDVSEREMTKYIIGTMSGVDTPMSPVMAGDRSYNMYMTNTPFERIQRERLQILDAQPEDIRALSGVVEAILATGDICVVGGETAIEENRELFMSVSTF